MTLFTTAGIFSKQDGEAVAATLHKLYEFLSAQGLKILLNTQAADLLKGTALSDELLAQHIDLAIVVGGDGTLLTAGRLLADFQVPIVGINLGRVGFLVDVLPAQMQEQLTAILQGDYLEDERCLLKACAWRGEEKLGQNIALNDVVLHARNEVRMIEFTTYIDGFFVNTQRADGLVISTPTGSTAYALSSGGPILHTSLDASILVPISPHTLTSRPIVIPNQSSIEIEMGSDRPVEALLSFDGHHDIPLVSGDRIKINASPKKMRLLHPRHYDYYHILRSKLHWGTQL
ncbi:NAD(+) kinase [uncultured Thiothrix sp.]|uniref:NAD(+) kinase n=1 Tax=uncultured Thiothrix sp. TaxID=223185 RepID=UPI002637A624|nr:NAD(+) kinase [uncultured Thiothrix sp.]